MVSGIGSANYVNQVTSDFNRTQIQRVGTTNSDEIVDEFIPSLKFQHYSFYFQKMDKSKVASFEDFVVERNRAVTGIENDSSYIDGINYEAEFQDYLKLNGCENEDELKSFAELMDTQGRVERATKGVAKAFISSILGDMQRRNPLANIDSVGITADLLENSRLEDLQEFISKSKPGSYDPGERVDAFKDLVSKNNNSGSGYAYSDLLLNLDIFKQQLADEQEAREAAAKNGGTYRIDYDKYAEQALEQYRRFA